MLLTDSFTYIHQPKTGGTFVAATLVRLHEARGDRIETVSLSPTETTGFPAVRPGLIIRAVHPTRHQHGTRQDIPASARHRLVVATVRNPLDRYVSQFEFAWWRVYPEMFGPVEAVRKRYPAYPDLTFSEFVHLTNEVSVPYRSHNHPHDTPGFHTQQFVEYFFPDPGPAFARLELAGEAQALTREVHGGMRYLNQVRLNEDLAALLADTGYTPTEIDAVRRAGPIWPPEGGRPAGSAWQPYYTPALEAFVRRKERWLFDWFPEFNR